MIQLIEPNFEEKVIYLILVHVNIENPTLDKKKNINKRKLLDVVWSCGKNAYQCLNQNFLKNLKWIQKSSWII